MPSGLFGPDALITPFFQLAVILQLHLLLGKRVPCETILGWGPRKALGLDCRRTLSLQPQMQIPCEDTGNGDEF